MGQIGCRDGLTSGPDVLLVVEEKPVLVNMLDIGDLAFVQAILDPAGGVTVEGLVHVVEGVAEAGVDGAIDFLELDRSDLALLVDDLDDVSLRGEHHPN